MNNFFHLPIIFFVFYELSKLNIFFSEITSFFFKSPSLIFLFIDWFGGFGFIYMFKLLHYIF